MSYLSSLLLVIVAAASVVIFIASFFSDKERIPLSWVALRTVAFVNLLFFVGIFVFWATISNWNFSIFLEAVSYRVTGPYKWVYLLIVVGLIAPALTLSFRFNETLARLRVLSFLGFVGSALSFGLV